MGWKFSNGVSSGDTDFNFDYHVSFTAERACQEGRARSSISKIQNPQGLRRSRAKANSVFYKDGERAAVFSLLLVLRTGENDKMNIHYHYLDLAPKGTR